MKSSWTVPDIVRRIGKFQAAVVVVKLHHNVHICRDPKDDMFLKCAALAKADVLVTGDKDLLSLGSFGSKRILTPHEYVAMPV